MGTNMEPGKQKRDSEKVPTCETAVAVLSFLKENLTLNIATVVILLKSVLPMNRA